VRAVALDVVDQLIGDLSFAEPLPRHLRLNDDLLAL
jgi:hypothetical protein